MRRLALCSIFLLDGRPACVAVRGGGFYRANHGGDRSALSLHWLNSCWGTQPHLDAPWRNAPPWTWPADHQILPLLFEADDANHHFPMTPVRLRHASDPSLCMDAVTSAPLDDWIVPHRKREADRAMMLLGVPVYGFLARRFSPDGHSLMRLRIALAGHGFALAVARFDGTPASALEPITLIPDPPDGRFQPENLPREATNALMKIELGSTRAANLLGTLTQADRDELQSFFLLACCCRMPWGAMHDWLIQRVCHGPREAADLLSRLCWRPDGELLGRAILATAKPYFGSQLEDDADVG